LKTDFLIIGGGIIGLTIAKGLRKKYPEKSIVIIEKETSTGFHASGRNSGVLHAGFYYSRDSLKAKFTKNGNQRIKLYCKENKLRLNENKKVVVTQNESELEGLFELEKRGRDNRVEVSIVNEKELADIEPNAKTFQYALYSPSTATIDPKEIINCLVSELTGTAVKIITGSGYRKKISDNAIRTTSGLIIEFGFLINAAALYADKIVELKEGKILRTGKYNELFSENV